MGFGIRIWEESSRNQENKTFSEFILAYSAIYLWGYSIAIEDKHRKAYKMWSVDVDSANTSYKLSIGIKQTSSL